MRRLIRNTIVHRVFCFTMCLIIVAYDVVDALRTCMTFVRGKYN